MFVRVIPPRALCILSGLIIATSVPGFAADGAPPSPKATVLTLEEALQRTLQRGPELVAADEELRAAAAGVRRAGRLPNPELSISLENVAGDGGYQDTDAAELTIALSQSIELGGKRRLRREVAELGRQLAANGERLARAEVQAEARRRFVAVLAAQEALALAREQVELTAKSLSAAEERINAGKAPAIDRMRLQGADSQARLGVTRAERTLLTTRQALAASWGDLQPDFERVEGDLGLLPDVPAARDVETLQEQSAAALNRRIATELLGKELEQARAGRIPDPTLTAGWRQFRESDENAWLFGVSFPLPLFDQGQEAVAAAGSRFSSAKAREVTVRNAARTALRTAWQAVADARDAAGVFDSQVVPAAREGFAAAEFGYRAGKFGLLELLDAQRSLFEARQQQLAARTDCHLAAIELQRLRGAAAAAAH